MEEQEKLKRAQDIIRKLANGIDPIGGSGIEEDSLIFYEVHGFDEGEHDDDASSHLESLPPAEKLARIIIYTGRQFGDSDQIRRRQCDMSNRSATLLSAALFTACPKCSSPRRR